VASIQLELRIDRAAAAVAFYQPPRHPSAVIVGQMRVGPKSRCFNYVKLGYNTRDFRSDSLLWVKNGDIHRK
jgi:hypothetical protein